MKALLLLLVPAALCFNLYASSPYQAAGAYSFTSFSFYLQYPLFSINSTYGMSYANTSSQISIYVGSYSTVTPTEGMVFVAPDTQSLFYLKELSSSNSSVYTFAYAELYPYQVFHEIQLFTDASPDLSTTTAYGKAIGGGYARKDTTEAFETDEYATAPNNSLSFYASPAIVHSFKIDFELDPRGGTYVAIDEGVFCETTYIIPMNGTAKGSVLTADYENSTSYTASLSFCNFNFSFNLQQSVSEYITDYDVEGTSFINLTAITNMELRNRYGRSNLSGLFDDPTQLKGYIEELFTTSEGHNTTMMKATPTSDISFSSEFLIGAMTPITIGNRYVLSLNLNYTQDKESCQGNHLYGQPTLTLSYATNSSSLVVIDEHTTNDQCLIYDAIEFDDQTDNITQYAIVYVDLVNSSDTSLNFFAEYGSEKIMIVKNICFVIPDPFTNASFDLYVQYQNLSEAFLFTVSNITADADTTYQNLITIYGQRGLPANSGTPFYSPSTGYYAIMESYSCDDYGIFDLDYKVFYQASYLNEFEATPNLSNTTYNISINTITPIGNASARLYVYDSNYLLTSVRISVLSSSAVTAADIGISNWYVKTTDQKLMFVLSTFGSSTNETINSSISSSEFTLCFTTMNITFSSSETYSTLFLWVPEHAGNFVIAKVFENSTVATPDDLQIDISVNSSETYNFVKTYYKAQTAVSALGLQEPTFYLKSPYLTPLTYHQNFGNWKTAVVTGIQYLSSDNKTVSCYIPFRRINASSSTVSIFAHGGFPYTYQFYCGINTGTVSYVSNYSQFVCVEPTVDHSDYSTQTASLYYYYLFIFGGLDLSTFYAQRQLIGDSDYVLDKLRMEIDLNGSLLAYMRRMDFYAPESGISTAVMGQYSDEFYKYSSSFLPRVGCTDCNSMYGVKADGSSYQLSYMSYYDLYQMTSVTTAPSPFFAVYENSSKDDAIVQENFSGVSLIEYPQLGYMRDVFYGSEGTELLSLTQRQIVANRTNATFYKEYEGQITLIASQLQSGNLSIIITPYSSGWVRISANFSEMEIPFSSKQFMQNISLLYDSLGINQKACWDDEDTEPIFEIDGSIFAYETYFKKPSNTSSIAKTVVDIPDSMVTNVEVLCGGNSEENESGDCVLMAVPTATPTATPSESPSLSPTSTPTISPTSTPTDSPSATPTISPASTPTKSPSETPSESLMATPSASLTASSQAALNQSNEQSGSSSSKAWIAAPVIGVCAVVGAIAFFIIRKWQKTEPDTELETLMDDVQKKIDDKCPPMGRYSCML